MARDTGTTITSASAFLDTRFWQHNAMCEFLAVLYCINVFLIRTCADVYGLPCMA